MKKPTDPLHYDREHGYTDDPRHIAATRSWVAAAVADGWAIKPTYGGPPHEGVETAATLERDGFVVHALMRDPPGGPWWKYQASVSVWGPDQMAVQVEPLAVYSWPDLQAGLRICKPCGARDIEPRRYSFAGRCCDACLPAMRATHERPGWCD